MCNRGDPDGTDLHNWEKIMDWLREERVDAGHIDQPQNKKRKTTEPSETDKMTNLRKVRFCAAAMSRISPGPKYRGWSIISTTECKHRGIMV